MPTLVVTRKVFLPKVLLFANIAFWKLVSFAFSSNICLDLGSTLVGESLQLQLSSSHSCATGVFANLASNVTVKRLSCSKDLSQAMSFDLTLQILQSTMSTRQPHSRTWRWRKVILWEIVFSFANVVCEFSDCVFSRIYFHIHCNRLVIRSFVTF